MQQMTAMGRRFQLGWLVIALLCVPFWSAPLSAAEPVKIGVLAFRPKPQTLAQWQPLATALQQAVPGRTFVIEALAYPEMNEAVAEKRLDFVLTNPGHYVLLTRRLGLTAPLATLAVDDRGRASTAFGGVIFTRSDRTHIHTLNDIKGKSIAVTNTDSLGGFQMQAYELSRQGIRLPQDATLVITGMPHDKVIEAVLSGQADVGFVRTGVMESMDREGKLALSRIRLINPQTHPRFTLGVSTRLYPEWPFAAMPGTDEDLARHVAAALFMLEENKAATEAMRMHGFVVPADYTPVADLLRELRMPPFDGTPKFTLADVWAQYRWFVVGAGVALVMILGLLALVVRRQRQLTALMQSLAEKEKHLRLVMMVTRDGVWDWNLTTDEVHFDPRYYLMAGYGVDEFPHRLEEFQQRVHPDDLAYVMTEAKKLLDEESERFEVEFRFRKKDDSYLWIFAKGQVVERDVQGNPLRFIGIHADITERKQAEKALHDSEERLRQTLEHSPNVAVQWYDRQGRVRYWNAASERLYGYSAAEALERTIDQLIFTPEETEAFRQTLARIAASGETIGPGEFPTHDRNGAERRVLSTIFPIPGQGSEEPLFVCMDIDITESKRVEEALQESEARLRSFVANQPGIAYKIDKDGIFTLSEGQGLASLGFKPGQMVGQSVFTVYQDAPEICAQIRQVLAGQTHTWETCLGELFFESWGSPLVDANGQIQGMIGFSSEITARKRAELQLARSRIKLQHALEETQAVLDNTLVGIAFFDAERRLQRLNHALATMFGYPEQALLGHTTERLYPSVEECRALEAAAYPALATGEIYDSERPMRRRDGGLFWCHIRGRAMQPGDLSKGFIWTLGDASARHAFEQQLRQAKEAAEAANRAKSAFLANMSHELRTPLNAMLGHAQILQRDTTFDDKQRRSVETIQRSGDHLITLINDILDLAKIEAGRLDLALAPCDLHALLRGLEELFKMRTQDQGIGFRYQEQTPLPALVAADEKRLRQVVMNLLSNAVKFTAQGEVRQEVGYAQGLLWIRVIDSGIGIPPDRIEGLFQPFQQEGTAEYRNQGTGLGLAIVKQLLTQMGGGIEVASVLGQGSRFTLRLPLVVLADTLADQPGQVGISQGCRRLDGGADLLCLGAVAQTLTPAQREALLELAGRGNILEIRKLVEGLPADGGGQVGRLREAAGRLDIKALRRILEE